MATTLSHGIIKPANPDTGDIWFPALANNAQIQNDHTHNGNDGAFLAVFTASILAANWGSPTNGTYQQTITMPTINSVQMSYDTCQIEFRLSTGEIVYPSITRVSASQYTIFTNDNTQTYTAIYR